MAGCQRLLSLGAYVLLASSCVAFSGDRLSKRQEDGTFIDPAEAAWAQHVANAEAHVDNVNAWMEHYVNHAEAAHNQYINGAEAAANEYMNQADAAQNQAETAQNENEAIMAAWEQHLTDKEAYLDNVNAWVDACDDRLMDLRMDNMFGPMKCSFCSVWNTEDDDDFWSDFNALMKRQWSLEDEAWLTNYQSQDAWLDRRIDTAIDNFQCCQNKTACYGEQFTLPPPTAAAQATASQLQPSQTQTQPLTQPLYQPLTQPLTQPLAQPANTANSSPIQSTHYLADHPLWN